MQKKPPKNTFTDAFKAISKLGTKIQIWFITILLLLIQFFHI